MSLEFQFEGILKDNYNSIDFTEVEQFKNCIEPRNISDDLIELRTLLVEKLAIGNKSNMDVIFHYDNDRRVTPQDQDYFFAPIPMTPYALGVVVPSDYGKTWIKVGDEVTKNRNLRINMTDYFVGENWKIHPEWVYCKYHYLEGHEFKTPELELLEFLKKLNDPNFLWEEQYDDDNSKLEFDAYYCNSELVQLLIFDAKLTNSSYGQWNFEDEDEKTLIDQYNATLRFVATMSGLTRWQFIYGEVEIEEDEEFGDKHTTAIDETWYKSAVLQHTIDPNSFVYFVPHISEPGDRNNTQVTASHAIFRQDGGKAAPGCVVGFQFSVDMMKERFDMITSKRKCPGCTESCADDALDCYVIDNNGYVILSENMDDVGTFFGMIEGAIMESMVEAEIFNSYSVYDYQALCFKKVLVSGNVNKIVNVRDNQSLFNKHHTN